MTNPLLKLRYPSRRQINFLASSTYIRSFSVTVTVNSLSSPTITLLFKKSPDDRPNNLLAGTINIAGDYRITAHIMNTVQYNRAAKYSTMINEQGTWCLAGESAPIRATL